MKRAIERLEAQDGPASAGGASPRCGPTKEKVALDGDPSKHQRKYIEHIHFDAIAGWPQVGLLYPRQARESCALARECGGPVHVGPAHG
jgi:hypothetical protein